MTGTARSLRRSSDTPLWVQLESELRRRLEAGDFVNRFPTDLELTQRYRVSRHTARHAVERLRADGLVTRERGRGTTVVRAQFQQPLGGLYSLFQLVEEGGAEQRSKVLALEVTTDAGAAERLQLDPDTELVYLDRLRLADDEPLARDQVWMPAAQTSELLDCDFSHTALYHELERIGGPRPTNGSERIFPVLPSAAERRLLSLDQRAAAFRLERTGLVGKRIVEWRVTVIRGDRFNFLADWSPGKSSPFRLTRYET